MSSHESLFRSLSHSLEPQPTGIDPVLPKLPGIRVVLFDIYGTLLVSGSGDIGTTSTTHRADALAAAFAALDVVPSCEDAALEKAFVETIAAHHERARAEGVAYPEVDILEVWRDMLSRLVKQCALASTAEQIDIARLAVEFEARVNPVWPMPDLEDSLEMLRARNTTWGVISNAQYFTPGLFPALLGRSLDELGCDPDLRYYSYEHRHAKPDPTMYRLAAQTLASRGIGPAEVLYVGNDMRNDVWPAAEVGFHTALFAGDARSLRMRDDDPDVADVRPTAIVTRLSQLEALLQD